MSILMNDDFCWVSTSKANSKTSLTALFSCSLLQFLSIHLCSKCPLLLLFSFCSGLSHHSTRVPFLPLSNTAETLTPATSTLQFSLHSSQFFIPFSPPSRLSYTPLPVASSASPSSASPQDIHPCLLSPPSPASSHLLLFVLNHLSEQFTCLEFLSGLSKSF